MLPEPQLNQARIAATGLACLLLAGTAVAQPAPTPATPLQGLYDCSARTDPAERLACFDAAVAALRAGETQGEIVAIDRAMTETIQREAFGFRIPSLPFFTRRPASADGASTPAPASASVARTPPPQEARTFQIVRLGRSEGRTSLITEEGQVWVLLDPAELRGSTRTPFQVRIRPAAMGSFILSVEGRNQGYRTRRVE